MSKRKTPPPDDVTPVSRYLTLLAKETIQRNGIDSPRALHLAEIIWRLALGWEEQRPDGTVRRHKPAAWAIQHVLDRVEGKVRYADEHATQSSSSKSSVRTRIRELVASDFNAFTDAILASGSGGTVPGHPPNMDRPKDGAEDSEDGA